MADKSLQFYRGPQSGIPTLKEAEPGWTTDEKRLYVGDGTNNVAIANKSDVTAVQSDLDTLEGKSVTVDTGGSVQPPETLTGPFKIIMTDEDDDEPESGGGLTQEQADQRYLQLSGGTIQGDLRVTGMGQIGGVGLGTMDGNNEFGSPIRLAGVVNETPNKPIGFGVLDDRGNIGAGLLIAHVEESSETDSFMFLTKKGEGASDVRLPYLTPLSVYSAATKSYVDNKVAAIDLPLAFGPQTVATSAWAANTTYSAQGYGFRASVPLSGVTADHIPDVTFAMADAVSGNLAPLADTYAGGIYIYAKEQPTATVNIASVVCTKGA